MLSQTPSCRALVLRESRTQRQPLYYHDVVVEDRPLPPLGENEILVEMSAAAFNRRDLWQRMGLYPAVGLRSVVGSDGAGRVIKSSVADDPLLNRRIFLTPMRGWDSHPEAPETGIKTVGGSSDPPPLGTFAEYVVVERDQVILTPEHLTDVQIAAWPLAGLTAWRATIINAQVKEGDCVLITGIGGGVALYAMQFCIARKARVFVSSSSEDKIRKAVDMGAEGGVIYRSNNWPTELAALLRSKGVKVLDTVIDSGGGNIMGLVGKHLKQGGRVVCFGMTGNPEIRFTMRDVLRNQRLIGSTLGSRKDLIEATEFIASHKIVPVVSHVLRGLEAADEGFELLKRGDQFGKIVVQIKERAKL